MKKVLALPIPILPSTGIGKTNAISQKHCKTNTSSQNRYKYKYYFSYF